MGNIILKATELGLGLGLEDGDPQGIAQTSRHSPDLHHRLDLYHQPDPIPDRHAPRVALVSQFFLSLELPLTLTLKAQRPRPLSLV